MSVTRARGRSKSEYLNTLLNPTCISIVFCEIGGVDEATARDGA